MLALSFLNHLGSTAFRDLTICPPPPGLDRDMSIMDSMTCLIRNLRVRIVFSLVLSGERGGGGEGDGMGLLIRVAKPFMYFFYFSRSSRLLDNIHPPFPVSPSHLGFVYR